MICKEKKKNKKTSAHGKGAGGRLTQNAPDEDYERHTTSKGQSIQPNVTSALEERFKIGIRHPTTSSRHRSSVSSHRCCWGDAKLINQFSPKSKGAGAPSVVFPQPSRNSKQVDLCQSVAYVREGSLRYSASLNLVR